MRLLGCPGRENPVNAAVPDRAHLALTRGRLSAFDPQDNGITAARLALALTVVVSHSVARGGFGLEPLVQESQGHVSLGFAAVIGFFAISGFLLARSRERTPLLAFVRNRGLRILPGYWVALLFGALVAAPLGAALAGNRVELGTALQYLASNVALLGDSASAPVQPAFGGQPVNGSLWTLGIEALAYLVLVVVQLRWLQGRLEAEPAPRLLLGDLNLTLPMVRLVSRRGWRPLACGPTHPNRPPGAVGRVGQIDHVLAGGRGDGGRILRVVRTRVAAGPISDHRALVADLELGPARG